MSEAEMVVTPHKLHARSRKNVSQPVSRNRQPGLDDRCEPFVSGGDVESGRTRLQLRYGCAAGVRVFVGGRRCALLLCPCDDGLISRKPPQEIMVGSITT